jgi:hypothetical protein
MESRTLLSGGATFIHAAPVSMTFHSEFHAPQMDVFSSASFSKAVTSPETTQVAGEYAARSLAASAPEVFAFTFGRGVEVIFISLPDTGFVDRPGTGELPTPAPRESYPIPAAPEHGQHQARAGTIVSSENSGESTPARVTLPALARLIGDQSSPEFTTRTTIASNPSEAVQPSVQKVSGRYLSILQGNPQATVAFATAVGRALNVATTAIDKIEPMARAILQAINLGEFDSLHSPTRVFHIAHLGSPLALVSDSIAAFIEESAGLRPSTTPAGSGHYRAWLLTAAIMTADAALLTYYYQRSRKLRRMVFASTRPLAAIYS